MPLLSQLSQIEKKLQHNDDYSDINSLILVVIRVAQSSEKLRLK
jgi:hypothetical protein